MKTITLILAAALLAGCVMPGANEPDRRGDGAQMGPPEKPPLPKPPLPAGVARNPDGSVTIHEPRCPNCQPWGF